MRQNDKTYLVIGSSNFLYRLGIKTILNVIGYDCEIIELDDFDECKRYLLGDEVFSFVLFDDFVSLPKGENYSFITQLSQENKIMMIGERIPMLSDRIATVNNLSEKKSFLDQFQQFFLAYEDHVVDNDVLTDREIDVLRQVALGLSNKEMADKLFISTNTVITHRKNITDKLGIKTIPGLTVYAIMHGIIIPNEVKY